MYVEKVTLEGFKSYSERTEIGPFDQHFNAITGLNGSGKSNILDALCFVMGIKDLKTVRAGDLQDLVYKHGQAGVTKATVSICFNNRDKDRSPSGYEGKEQIVVTRQVVVGGRDKFTINGTHAQPGRVKDMFHSVSMNVNNPHFLIMQGRITRVINMKPPQILGMLEEAAGTKLYEKKREQATATLDKKDRQLQDIDESLNGDLKAAVERIEKEKAEYVAWQQAVSDVERLEHVIQAYRYWKHLLDLEDARQNMQTTKAKLEEVTEDTAAFQEQLAERQAEVKELNQKLERECAGEVKELTGKAHNLSVAVSGVEAAVKGTKDNLKTAEADLDSLKADLEAVSEERMRDTQEQLSAAAAASEQAAREAEEAQQAAAAQLEGIRDGDGRDGSNRSIGQRIKLAKEKLRPKVAEEAEAANTVQFLSTEVGKAKADVDKRQDGNLQREMKEKEKAVAACKKALAATPLDSDKLSRLEQVVRTEGELVVKQQQKCHELSCGIESVVRFKLMDPQGRVDARRVHGKLARLLRLKDGDSATALGVAAGGKLHHLVVDTADVGKALIDNKCLRERLTIVPLDKTRAGVVAEDKRRRAHAVTSGRATLALDLVDFEPHVQRAAEYALGGTFVCKDMTAAKQVAFGRDVAVRAVTVEGDDVNPSGTLTGGSRRTQLVLLARLDELAAAERELDRHKRARDEAEAELKAMESAVCKHRQVAEQLELAEHELRCVQDRAASSAACQAASQLGPLETQLERAQEYHRDIVRAKQELEAEVAELEQQEKQLKTNKDALVKAAQKKLTAATKAAEAAARKAAADDEALKDKVADLASQVGNRHDLQAQLAELEVAIEKHQETLSKQAKELEGKKQQLQEVQEQLEAKKAGMQDCQQEVTRAKEDCAELQAKLSAMAKKTQKLKANEAKLQQHEGNLGEIIKEMERAHTWLVRDREQLGAAGGQYDFAALDMEAQEARFVEAVHHKRQQERCVNKKVMSSADSTQREYDKLVKKREVVQEDKEKIQMVIAELDTKKEETLEKTWEEVDGHFGQIFSTLLPGTQAKLRPPAGKSFLDGLEVHVAFGGAWKDSLSELSGGQRSLLALSLVLALLRFKPSPLYILDEVDAALDLSHTQNIGQMIQSQFPHAQFIIVSLKEGMFSNANVLFRTRFVDGASRVARESNVDAGTRAPTAGKSKRQRRLDDQENECQA